MMPLPTENVPVDEAAQAVEQADLKAGRALASRRDHPLVKVLGKIGDVGDQGPLYAIGVSIAAAGLLKRNRRLIAGGLSMVGSVAIADWMKTTVKGLVKRSRPDHLMEKGEYRFETGGSDKKEEQSFPSGHVACSVGAAGTLARVYPAAAPYVGGAAVLIASSRVIKGRHWPLDIAAGLVIGLVADQLMGVLAAPLIRRSRR